MRQIHKQKEPNSLTTHRLQKFADYDNYTDKDDVRKGLYNEQRGICCYCMGYIQPTDSTMKIEHFQCQTGFPALQLDYNNMLGACLGNTGQPEHLQHCDTRKGNKPLKFNPADLSFATQSIKFSSDGTISSTDDDFNTQLKDVLNLNGVNLKNNRKAALSAFISQAERKHKGRFQKDTLQRWIEDYSGAGHQNRLQPYCQIIVYWLQKRLNKA